jgi:hypothetical protein
MCPWLNFSLYFISQENGKKLKQMTHLEKSVMLGIFRMETNMELA